MTGYINSLTRTVLSVCLYTSVLYQFHISLFITRWWYTARVPVLLVSRGSRTPSVSNKPCTNEKARFTSLVGGGFLLHLVSSRFQYGITVGRRGNKRKSIFTAFRGHISDVAFTGEPTLLLYLPPSRAFRSTIVHAILNLLLVRFMF